MKLKEFLIAICTLVLVFFILAGVFSPLMPKVMASHWNVKGEVDGTISQFWGVFLFPIMSLGMAAILLVIPKIDSLKVNTRKVKSYSYMLFRKFGQTPQSLTER